MKSKCIYKKCFFFSVFFSVIALLMVTSTAYELIIVHLLSKSRPIDNYPILLIFHASPAETNKNNILASFSVYNNGGKLFKTTSVKSANIMECVNGIRVMSIVWVIYSHTYVTFMLSATMNIVVMGEVRTMLFVTRKFQVSVTLRV